MYIQRKAYENCTESTWRNRNLDSLNEGIILKALKESAENKTIVLVSHSESTMNIADVVYEMDNGRLS